MRARLEGYPTRMFRATEEANRQAILRVLPRRPGARVLDVGCHTGDFTLRVADRIGAGLIAGVDLIPEHVAIARSRGIEAVEGDVDACLPFGDGAFDVVHANQVIEHVRRTDRFLAEIARVLAPGGAAVISTNNLASWHNVVSLALGYQPFPQHVSDEVIVGNPLNPEDGRAHEDAGRTHLRLFTGRSLAALAEHHGLAVTGIETVGYYPLPPRAARLATRLDALHGAFLVVSLGLRADQPTATERSGAVAGAR